MLRANNPLEHLEMLLLRVIYAASLPDPGELAKAARIGRRSGDAACSAAGSARGAIRPARRLRPTRRRQRSRHPKHRLPRR